MSKSSFFLGGEKAGMQRVYASCQRKEKWHDLCQYRYKGNTMK